MIMQERATSILKVLLEVVEWEGGGALSYAAT